MAPHTLEAEYLIQSWQTEDGLPQNSVTSIAQTPDGYLWLGTFNGLARFDGARFVVFDSTNTPELKSSRIVHLYLDRRGSLWIVSEFGDLARLSEGRFAAVTEADGLPPNGAGILAEDLAGDLWMAGRRNEGCYRFENGKFVRRIEPSPGIDRPIFALISSSDGTFWAGQKGELIRLQPDGPAPFSPREGVWWDAGLQKLARSRDGGVWAMTSRALTKLGQGRWTERRNIPLEVLATAAICEDQRGDVWVGTWSQGLLLSKAGESFQQVYLASKPSPESMRAIFEDREGNLWIGTDGTGLFRLKRRLFQTFGTSEGLAGRIVKSVTEDRAGRIWALSHSQVTWFANGEPPGINRTNLSIPGAWCAMADRSGTTWIGSYGAGLYRHNEEGLFQFPKPEGKSSWVVTTLFQDRGGGIWVGGEEGLWHVEELSVRRIAPFPSLNKMDVRAMADDARGRLYVGLNGGGLLRYDGRDWRQFTRRDGLGDDQVWSLCVDAENTVWVGTLGRGLTRFKADEFFNFSAPQTRLPGVISSITEDDDGNLWVGSNRGIHRVSRRDLNELADGKREKISPMNYDKADGLATTECTSGLQPASWKARDGRLWFATVNGLSVVNPRDLPSNPHAPPVIIEEILIDDQAPISNAQSSVEVPPGGHRVEIHFTGLSFTDPRKVRFRYQLEDHDRDWIETSDRKVAYTRLPPGSYRFRVTACNNDGVWNETGAMLGLNVLPQFWQTWWFALLVVAAASGLIAAMYRARLARIEGLARLRLRIASDLHDEVGSNLGSIALNSEWLQRNPRLSEEERQDVVEINRVAVQTGQTIREITWLISPGFDTSTEMVERMKEVSASMLVGREHRFVLPPDMLPQKLTLESRRHFFLIFKEILHNIVKHSEATRVEIVIAVKDGKLDLVVMDNGRGFDEGTARRGHGLNNLSRRAGALGGTLQIKSEPSRGTTIRLTAPLRN